MSRLAQAASGLGLPPGTIAIIYISAIAARDAELLKVFRGAFGGSCAPGGKNVTVFIQENFPSLARQANIQIQEIQRTPHAWNWPSRH